MGEKEEVNIDDYEQFDELEKSFHKVVSELVSDQSLTTFREEYEKLHSQLVESHQNNLILIDRCKQLNNDILANANKVSSVMQLSQNDQRTIAGLRHEFEKAWRLVEIAQEKEQKSKDVIESLKQEVSKLTKLVEQGSALAFTQESSLQETETSIKMLKKEIQAQEMQIQTMEQNLEEVKQQSNTLVSEKESLETEFEEITKENTESKDEEIELSDTVDKLIEELTQTKNNITEGNSTIQNNTQRISQMRQQVASTKERSMERKRDLKADLEDLNANKASNETKKKVLEDKIKFNSKCENDAKLYHQSFLEKDAKIKEAKQDLDVIMNEYEMTKSAVEEAKAAKEEIIAEKDKYKKRLNDARKELYLLVAEYSDLSTKINQTHRDLEKSRTEKTVIQNESANEVKEREIIESAQQIIGNESIGIKASTHELRGKAVKMQTEIEDYQIKASGARSNLFQINEEVKQREIESDANTKKLSGLYETVKHTDSLTESIKSDRDLLHRLLQTAADENQKMIEDNKGMMLIISQLKSDIREKDQLCLITHKEQRQLATALVHMAAKNEKMRNEVHEKEMLNTELRNRIQRARHLLSQTDLQNMKQQQVINELKSTSFSLTNSITQKSNELELIKEEIYLLNGRLTSGGLGYKTKVEEVEKLKQQLLFEVSRQKELLNNVTHSKALWRESIQLQKTLTLEQGKRKALEEELERPMNVHRWRFLEGTNPELAQLLRMSMELRDRLMTLIYKIQRLQKVKEDKEKKAEIQMKHLKFSYNGQIQEEMTYLTETLKTKVSQLEMIQEKVFDQHSNVSSQKDVISNLREMLRNEKSDFYSLKKKTDEIRASTVKESRRPGAIRSPPRSPDHKFVGGGFSISQLKSVSRPPTSLENKKPTMTGKSTLSPHIVSPNRAHTSVKKRLPSGWNPQRGQLSPFIPTVSSSENNI